MSECYHCEIGEHVCGGKCLEHYKREVDRLEQWGSNCRAAVATAMHELELAVQGKWDGVAYVKNVRDGLIKAHDDLCKEQRGKNSCS